MRQKIAIITPSYRADFDLAQDLCASMDKFFRGPHEHIIVVPRCDLDLFRNLDGGARRIVSKEEILGDAGFFRLPVPVGLSIFGRTVRLREQWFRLGSGRLSGWLIQQLIKLSVPQITDCEICLFIDSDIVMVRDFSIAEMYSGKQLMLHSHKRGLNLDTHKLWHQNAKAILGITRKDEYATNHIGPMVPWLSSRVRQLQQHITRTHDKDWRIVLSETKDVSEYILYGMYNSMALNSSDHIEQDLGGFTKTLWVTPEDGALDHFMNSLTVDHAAICIQSTIPLSSAGRRALVERMIATRDR
jgi:hypothetical protein